jgi:hypothetical protein
MRVLAATLRQMYLALVQEGFSMPEALSIIGSTIAAAFKAQGGES